MKRARSRILMRIGAVAVLLAIACGALLYALLIFRLPPPTGPYAIGTRMLYLQDKNRSNAIGPEVAHSGRDIAVQLWYPASPSRNRFAPYRLRAESTSHAAYMSFIATHSRQDAPIAASDSPWHVLLFNPAWGSRRGQSTALMEDLASHGFVVAAIDHPGRTGPIWWPDGRVIPVVPDPDVDDETHSTVERVEAAVARETEKETLDASFVLDQLEILNQKSGSDLYHMLDTEHAGALGHSLGGCVAANVCSVDPRVLAAFSMSAPIFGRVRETGLRKPLLSISEDPQLKTPQQLAQMDAGNRIDAEADILDAEAWDRQFREFGGYRVILHGTNHSNYSDKAFYFPFKRFTGEDRTPRDRVLLIVRAYAEQFFAKTLRGESAPLLDPSVTAPFPEVTQKYFPGSGGK